MVSVDNLLVPFLAGTTKLKSTLSLQIFDDSDIFCSKPKKQNCSLWAFLQKKLSSFVLMIRVFP